ncbi:hypothetical protein [Alteromonas sp. BMJM2]|uniref:hypothetical protein n=1 Tax=Alteromonas sp. BMJM2 TaxID=2954241 RepID=UPI0022B5B6EC|nr:hypothetical protein [Alteromonas sp. BMJM2]
MRCILRSIKNVVPILVLFFAWSYTIEVDSMHYPENMGNTSSNPSSPDYAPEYGLCFACDHELIPDGDRYEPDLICPNSDCDQSPYYVEE